MTDTLSARIAKKKQQAAHVHNRALFLSLRPDIVEALDEGWSILSIWETLHDEKKVTFGYQAFRRYVQQYIGNRIPSDGNRNTRSTVSSHPSPLPGFIFRPNVDPKDIL